MFGVEKIERSIALRVDRKRFKLSGSHSYEYLLLVNVDVSRGGGDSDVGDDCCR